MSDGFSIEADFTAQDLENWINDDVQDWISDMTAGLIAGGKILVDKARAKTKSEGGFGNITWNLRSSIGLCAVNQGRIIETYFPPIGKGEHGNTVGREMAERLALYSQGRDDVVVVFVAGENYAELVQTTERDVIYTVIGGHLEDLIKSI
jgi:hypothetical protein